MLPFVVKYLPSSLLMRIPSRSVAIALVLFGGVVAAVAENAIAENSVIATRSSEMILRKCFFVFIIDLSFLVLDVMIFDSFRFFIYAFSLPVSIFGIHHLYNNT